MVRIGAKYTAKGYLDEIFDFHPLDNVQTWDLLTQGTKPNDVNAVIKKYREYFAPHTLNINESSQKSHAGNYKTSIKSYIPRCVEFSSGGDKSENKVWNELGILMQIMQASFKRNKYYFDFYNSFYCISNHALRRIYERNGGCEYSEFSNLVFTLFEELELNLSHLLAEGVFLDFQEVPDDGFLHPKIAAVPCMGGLAIVEIANLSVEKMGLLAPVKVYFDAKGASLRGSSFDIVSTPGYLEETISGRQFHTSPHYMVRTFYGFEDLNDTRKESLLFLDLLLRKRHKNSRISTAALHPNHLTGKLCYDVEAVSVAPSVSGLKVDAIQSLGWLKDPGEKFICALQRQ